MSAPECLSQPSTPPTTTAAVAVAVGAETAETTSEQPQASTPHKAKRTTRKPTAETKAAAPPPEDGASDDATCGENKKMSRFSMKSTAARLALGEAVRDVAPYALPRGKSGEVGWTMVKEVFVEKMKQKVPGTPHKWPSWTTLRDNSWLILSAWNKADKQSAKGTGTTEQFDEFDALWSGIAADVAEWEKRDATNKCESEKLKAQRLANKGAGEAMQQVIMQRRCDRKKQAATTEQQQQQQEEDEAAANSDAAGTLSKDEKYPLQETVAAPSAGLSFTRKASKRGREEPGEIAASAPATQRRRASQQEQLLEFLRNESAARNAYRERQLELEEQREKNRAAELEMISQMLELFAANNSVTPAEPANHPALSVSAPAPPSPL